ncbi:unnamed protein product [Thlaspi arvense]|uniref:F-box domain-containing protein n=1 Tax=Thlaspi arvense TaxID=13288 RepID=A0AAU9RIP3_THLAR|nr:unnamed protein product [Thlaspi arvense]
MADFFSLLPDTLIILIISSLPFKEAARTSVLSKRWRRFFHETKTVDFDETHFIKESTEEDQSKKDTQRRAFLDFLSDWVRNSTAPVLNKLRLAISNPQDSALQVNNCVRFAVDRKAKILELDFSDPSWNEESFENHDALFDLPPFVYEHDTLEFLKLFSCHFLSSGFENFTSLKSISLGWIELPNSSLGSLLSTCRFLENLSLKKCWGLEYISVSAPRLKSLVIDKCLDLENGVWINSRTKLRVFKYIGLLVNVEIECWRDLEEAYLDYGLESNLRDCGDVLYQTLDNVYSVSHLTMCSYMLQVYQAFSLYLNSHK